jgi:probable FeS assembly SUF system protein SufT
MSTATSDQKTVNKDVPATVVPSGESILIPEGASLQVTHRLGGNFTVVWDYGMARISGEHAEAIDEEVPEEYRKPEGTADHEGPPDGEALWEALKKVFDPEIPVNIVDLGLVYSLEAQPEEVEGDTRHVVEVKMTLTAPGCGMGPAIAEDARQNLMRVPGVDEAKVDIVWDPPWHQDMISEEGKMVLGLI